MTARVARTVRAAAAVAASVTMDMSSEQAVRALLGSDRAELIGFVRKRAGHLVDPEDVVHRAAAKALASAGDLRDPSRARAWLYRIVRNTLTDELRQIGLPAGDATELDELVDPSTPAPAGDVSCKCALDIARTIRPDYASILERTVLDDLPVTDVARELGITANNAMVRLHRARKALRAAVVERCGTTSMADCLDCTCSTDSTCRAMR